MTAAADRAATAVVAAADGRARLVVGIAGSPGAGKSTFAVELAARLDGDGVPAALVPMDGFHLPQARLVELGRRERMGAPDTFDVDGYLDILARLRQPDGEVLAPGFDRDVEEAVPNAIAVPAGIRVVITEGNYLLLDEHGWGRVAALLDLALFVRVDETLRHERLIARHVAFGKTPESAREWALGTDERNARRIEPTADRADLVLDLD